MTYKIAIASTDGKVVNQHFGKADKFLIINVNDDNRYQFEGNRETTAACLSGQHSDDGLERNISLLSDCTYVLASQIGPGAEYVLNKKGMTPFSISNYIDDAIEKIIVYHNRVTKKS